jgi:parvulin-like peptidyl-prolyl isomerase
VTERQAPSFRRRSAQLGLPLAALLLLLAAGCGSSAKRTLPADGVVLVGDQVVTKGDLAKLMYETRAEYAEQGNAFPRPGSAAYKVLQDQSLKSLIQSSELDQSAAGMKLKITQAQVDAEVRDLLKRSFDNDSDKLKAELASRGLTQADLRKRARQLVVEDAIRAKLTRSVSVSSVEVRDYYAAHRARYAGEDVQTRRVRSILVASRSLATRLSARLRAGAGFTQLAASYSRAWHGASGDAAITITRGGSPEGFEKVAFSLRAGQVSGPVKAPVGWYVIQALGPVQHTGAAALASVQNSIQAELLDGKPRTLLSDWLAKTNAAFCARGIVFRSGYRPVEDPCAGTKTPSTQTA